MRHTDGMEAEIGGPRKSVGRGPLLRQSDHCGSGLGCAGSTGFLPETSTSLEPARVGPGRVERVDPRGTASSGPSVGTGRLEVAAGVAGWGAGIADGWQPITTDIASNEKINAAIGPMPTGDKQGRGDAMGRGFRTAFSVPRQFSPALSCQRKSTLQTATSNDASVAGEASLQRGGNGGIAIEEIHPEQLLAFAMTFLDQFQTHWVDGQGIGAIIHDDLPADGLFEFGGHGSSWRSVDGTGLWPTVNDPTIRRRECRLALALTAQHRCDTPIRLRPGRAATGDAECRLTD